MKMTRKWIAFVLTICVLFSMTGAAYAETPVNDLAVYTNYQMDENTGEWSVSSNESWLAWQLIERNATSYADAFLFFELLVTGNINTGRITPVLQVSYIGSKDVFPTCVSFVCDGVRYDYTVSCVETKIGYEHAEIMRIALDQAGVEMLRTFAGAEEVLVNLGGGENKCQVTSKLREKYYNPYQRVHGLTILGLTPMLEVLDDLDFASYDMFDLNETQWTAAGGFDSEYQQVVLQPEGEFALKLDKDFEMLSTGNYGTQVTKLQERLMELGYLSMSLASGNYYESTAEAVRMAQQWYGMLPTGNADAAFVDKLFSEDQSPAARTAATEETLAKENLTADTQAEFGVVYVSEGAGELVLDRNWVAGTVSSISESGMSAQRSASSQDNLLVIADGSFVNLSTDTLSLYSGLEATVVYADTYRYECQVVCESNGGERFDSSMLPMAESRVVFYAEVPARLADESFTLEIRLGGYTLTYALD